LYDLLEIFQDRFNSLNLENEMEQAFWEYCKQYQVPYRQIFNENSSSRTKLNFDF
jgi:hypothetical protein